MQVRRATREDLSVIGRIYSATHENNAASQMDFWQSLLATGGLLVAEDDDSEVIGFGTVDVSADEQIKQLYVLPEYQGRRVSSMLLARLEEVAGKSGLYEVVLHAAPGAVAFYSRAGYNAISPDADSVHDHDGVMMSKKLIAEK